MIENYFIYNYLQKSWGRFAHKIPIYLQLSFHRLVTVAELFFSLKPSKPQCLQAHKNSISETKSMLYDF